MDSLKAQQAELRKGLEAIKAQLGSSLQAQAQAVERSARSVDELRQRQESLRSDLVAVVERELGGAPAASRAATPGRHRPLPARTMRRIAAHVAEGAARCSLRWPTPTPSSAGLKRLSGLCERPRSRRLPRRAASMGVSASLAARVLRKFGLVAKRPLR